MADATINFNATVKEEKLIFAIAERAVAWAEKIGYDYLLVDAVMDITACHLNGTPLDLDKLLYADDFNFAHDVLGIWKNLNRRTGKIMNCFLPRCSK